MKNFNEWNDIKKNIEKQNRNFYVKPREVVWIHLGVNVGDEENGKGDNFQRPVVVLKVFNKNIFFGIPLSTKIKDGNKYYFRVFLTDKNRDPKENKLEERSAMLTHVRLYDTKRIISHLGFIEKESFEKLKTATRAIL